MGLFSRDLKTIDDLFNHTLQDIYYAEKQILKTLPKLIDTATDAELKKGLKQHLAETEEQVRRLEEAFALLGQEPKGTRCPGIDGILSEGDEVLSNVDGRAVTNAAVIASAQAVEHYEITRYGTLIAWATELGHDALVPFFERNLREEKAADKKLTAIAEARVNKGPRSKGTVSRRPAGKSAVKKAAPRKHPQRRKAG
jgi:ferritin-like metal-binding protein YciE